MAILCRIGAVLSHLTAGLIIGLGFVAAYAKFNATSPTMTQLLDVGRNQFSALHWIEGITIPIVCLIGIIAKAHARIVSVTVLGLFAIQLLVILPSLDSRMVRSIKGESLPPSNLHLYYVAVSFLIVLGLISLGVFLQSTSRHSPTQNL